MCNDCHISCAFCNVTGLCRGFEKGCTCGAKPLYSCKSNDCDSGFDEDDELMYIIHHYCEEHKDMVHTCTVRKKRKQDE